MQRITFTSSIDVDDATANELLKRVKTPDTPLPLVLADFLRDHQGATIGFTAAPTPPEAIPDPPDAVLGTRPPRIDRRGPP